MDDNTDVFHIMHTMRAMRRLKPDPVPDELIEKILIAGTAAPNGGNSQRWRFLVIKDPDTKRQIQPYYRRAFEEVHARNLEAVEYLTDHFHEAPVWIVACLSAGKNATRSTPGSIYPAVQNMLLAARALGLGATLTARHLHFEKEVETILGLPEDMHSYAIIPIGYPMGNFGPTRRAPLSEVAYLDRWGEPWPAAG
jgi:nitroreductase